MPVSRPLNELLKATSRSFYLTLRVLPSPVRSQIGLAYLLARTTDTIADTELVPITKRLAALEEMRSFIRQGKCRPLGFGQLVETQSNPAERRLLENRESILAALFSTVPENDRNLICELLEIIISGQELDLRRFAGSADGNIIALKTAAELDDYTYRVAGCVGEFWTKICRAHLFPTARLDEKQFIQDGIRFGKGLQLVNILRDLPADLKNGRCYLPLDRLEPLHLVPETLLSPVNEQKFLPLFREHLDKADAHLAAGWRYTNTLPFGQFRVRLACAWPILIGARTIDRLRAVGVAEIQQRVKVSRGEVRGIIFHSLAVCAVPPLWRRLYLPAGKAVASGGDLA